MLQPLRAFLILFQRDGDTTIRVCRDLSSVLEQWNLRPEIGNTTGVLHIGFDRPPSEAFLDLVAVHTGRMLLTAAAKYGLPEQFPSSREPIGTINGLPIYLALRGWGYELDEEPTTEGVALNDSLESAAWIAALQESTPYLANVARQHGIVDDHSYLELEQYLEQSYRQALGAFRFEYLLSSHPSANVRPWLHAPHLTQVVDVCLLARMSPPWLLTENLENLGVNTRTHNALAKHGIHSVYDLSQSTLQQIISIRSVGPRTIEDLAQGIEFGVAKGPSSRARNVNVQPASVSPPLPDGEATSDLAMVENQNLAISVEPEAPGVQDNVGSALATFLSQLSDREREVITRRLGLHGEPETLNDIAQDFGVTRERIRQIEAKTVSKLHNASWLDYFSNKMEQLLADRQYPLPVLGVDAADPWLAGCSKHAHGLARLLRITDRLSLSIISVDGIEYFSLIDQLELKDIVRSCSQTLKAGVAEGWSEQYCKSLVRAACTGDAESVADYVWDEVSRLCHFAEIQDGTKELVAFGRSVEDAVAAILIESPFPLHYREIASKASERLERAVDIRRAHNAAAQVGILLGRGIYGADRHIGLDNEERDELCAAAEAVLEAGQPGRQWHTAEILEELEETDQLPDASVDAYVLNYVLQQSDLLTSLGRMVWVMGERKHSASRIEREQAIIAILEEAGKPLHLNDIKARLIEVRGVGRYFQIFARDPLVRLGRNEWGLNDRDTEIPRSEQPFLLEEVALQLHKRGQGLHLSEMDEIRLPYPISTTLPYLIFSLASQDDRFATDQGGYLYLAQWGGSRRVSVSEAVKELIYSSDRSFTTEEIRQYAAHRTKRDLAASAVYGILQRIEAEYDNDRQRWRVRSEE